MPEQNKEKSATAPFLFEILVEAWLILFFYRKIGVFLFPFFMAFHFFGWILCPLVLILVVTGCKIAFFGHTRGGQHTAQTELL